MKIVCDKNIFFFFFERRVSFFECLGEHQYYLNESELEIDKLIDDLMKKFLHYTTQRSIFQKL